MNGTTMVIFVHRRSPLPPSIFLQQQTNPEGMRNPADGEGEFYSAAATHFILLYLFIGANESEDRIEKKTRFN
jgi:hypothetical protein